MAVYGAKYLRWAEKTAAGVAGTSFPTYDSALDVGPLVTVGDTITYASARNYGDNQLQESVDEFQEIAVTASMTEMPLATAAKIYGAALSATGGIGYGVEDAAPEGCLGFYTTKLSKDLKTGVQKKFYQGVFYPSLKGNRQGTTYNTKGQNISFANGQANFLGNAEENGFYQVFSANLDTEEEAKAWVDKMMAGGEAALAEARKAAA